MKNATLMCVALMLLAVASVARADISCKDYCKSVLSMDACFGTPDNEMDLCEIQFMESCMDTCEKVSDPHAVCDDLEEVWIPGRGSNRLNCICGSGSAVSICIRRCPVSIIQRGICATACILKGQGRPAQFSCAQDTTGTCV